MGVVTGNELLWIILVLINLGLVTLAYAFFGKAGLYVWIALSVILANIQVLKIISLFGLVTALGNVIYGSIFLATDILNEKYGKNSAKKGVYIGFFVLIATTIIMQLCLYFIPHESDFAQPALETIFGFLPRIALASLTAYFISQNHDVILYTFLKKRFKWLWLRNNLSTMVSQLIDNIVFTLIAFVGIFEWSIIFQIFFVSYVMKFFVAVLDTPFLYLAKRIKPIDWDNFNLKKLFARY